MRNAKKELLEIVKELKIKCAYIWIDEGYDFDTHENTRTVYNLPLNYVKSQYDEFIESLNFNYDAGFGGQNLFGNVWFEDETWLERGEYDGSEWWEHKIAPEIPKECN